MKKALQISLAKTLFTIEEDAYARLENYLASVRDHFEKTTGYTEIINDIESRIAEQLIEGRHKIVTIEAIERILATMGRVEDFDDGAERSGERTQSTTNAQVGKKLYRDPDNALIAGVCSGIAAYMGWDTIWVRLAFIVLSFFNGLGIMLYIFLWIIMPEAKSAAQKLEMAGSPVTIETLSETVRERFDEIKQDRRGTFAKIASIPAQLIKGVGRALRGIAPVFRILFGAFLTLAAGSALVGLLITSGFLTSGMPYLTDELPLTSVLPGALYVIAVVSVMLVIMIPILAVFVGGIALLLKKHIFSGSVSATLLGVWFLALAVSGFSIAKTAHNYFAYTSTAPEYQEVTTVIPIEGAFTKLSVERGLSIEITEGSETTLSATGRAKQIERLSTRVEGGTLYISRAFVDGYFCILCDDGPLSLSLTTGEIEAITALHGSRVTAEEFLPASDFSIVLRHGSYGSLKLEVARADADLAHGSYLSIEGSADDSKIEVAHGSRVDGDSFNITRAEIDAAHGSSVHVGLLEKLDVSAAHGSRIRYEGSPEVRKDVRHGSSVSNDSVGD